MKTRTNIMKSAVKNVVMAAITLTVVIPIAKAEDSFSCAHINATYDSLLEPKIDNFKKISIQNDISELRGLARGFAEFASTVARLTPTLWSWDIGKKYCLSNPEKNIKDSIFSAFKIDQTKLTQCLDHQKSENNTVADPNVDEANGTKLNGSLQKKDQKRSFFNSDKNNSPGNSATPAR